MSPNWTKNVISLNIICESTWDICLLEFDSTWVKSILNYLQISMAVRQIVVVSKDIQESCKYIKHSLKMNGQLSNTN